MLILNKKRKEKTRMMANRLIERHRPNMIKPEVLCIGPQKTATTWLFMNFYNHPEIWIPSVKEIHYLSEGIHLSLIHI